MVLVEIKVLWIGASNYQLMQGMYLFKKKKKTIGRILCMVQKVLFKILSLPPPKDHLCRT